MSLKDMFADRLNQIVEGGISVAVDRHTASNAVTQAPATQYTERTPPVDTTTVNTVPPGTLTREGETIGGIPKNTALIAGGVLVVFGLIALTR